MSNCRYEIYIHRSGLRTFVDQETGRHLPFEKVIGLLNELDAIKSQQPAEREGRIRCFYFPLNPTYVWEVYEDGRIILYYDRFYPEGKVSKYKSVKELLATIHELVEYEAWEVDEHANEKK